MNRTMGESVTTLSIATAQIFELTVTAEELKNPPDAIFYNVRTLFRNFWESYDNEMRPNVRSMPVDFIEELKDIELLTQQAGLGSFFYYPSYSNLKRILPKALLKEPTTQKAIEFRAAEEVIKQICRPITWITETDTLVPSFNGRVWLVSHYPVDLLSRHRISDLKLLESHTGAVKDPSVWNSKIFSNPKHRHLPFNALTLSVWGDKSNLLTAHPGQYYKKGILQMAERDRWTPLTTSDKIIASINKIDDKELKAFYRAALLTGS